MLHSSRAVLLVLSSYFFISVERSQQRNFITKQQIAIRQKHLPFHTVGNFTYLKDDGLNENKSISWLRKCILKTKIDFIQTENHYILNLTFQSFLFHETPQRMWYNNLHNN